jgi:hypothetical protein
MHGFSRRCSTDQYSTPSETGSQYNGLHSSDSGYSTRSCTTRSIAASYAVDTACSPSLILHDYEQDEKVPPWDINSTHHGDAMDIAEQPGSPSLLSIDTIKCEYPGCTWTGKCPSDKRCTSIQLSHKSPRLTSAGNTKLGTKSYSNAMNQIALERKGSGRSMTWHGIRNASTRKSQSVDQRCCTCALDIIALGAIRSGLDWIIFANISLECIIPRTQRHC